MSFMLQYIVKLSIGLPVIYLFYKLVLHRLTFYTANRWFLLVYSVLCFVIPVINIFPVLQHRGLQDSIFINYIPSIGQINPSHGQPVTTATASFNWQLLYLLVLATGIIFMLARLLFQYRSLLRLQSSAVLLYNDSVKLYHIDRQIIPFSFGNSIFVNQGMHTEDELKEIIKHEFIHVKQHHSLDMIWGEILCMLNWYNPFAWLIRKAIRQNLEFIADDKVLQNGIDRKQYQYLLLKVTGSCRFGIGSNFNFSSLKKRIAMMNKNKTAKKHLVKFLLILPLMLILILSFRQVRSLQLQHVQATLPVPAADTIPAPPAPLAHSKSIKQVQYTELNKDIVKVIFNNGDSEVYNFEKPEEKMAFEKKYQHTEHLSLSTIASVESAISLSADVRPDISVVTSAEPVITKADLIDIDPAVSISAPVQSIIANDGEWEEIFAIKKSNKADFEATDFDKFSIHYKTEKKSGFSISVNHGKVMFNTNGE